MNKEKITKKSLLLQKPSGSIAIGGNLSVIQRKFYNLMLKNAKESLKKNKNAMIFSIKLKTLQGVLNDRATNGKHYSLYKREIEEMFKTVIEYNVFDKDRIIKHEIKAHLLDNLDWKINTQTREVELRYSIPIFVREAINKIISGDSNALYANIDLTIIKGLRSKYAIILYELCKDYEKAEVPIMTIEQLKKVLGVENKKTYKLFNKIKIAVLDPAIKELNTNPNVPFKVSYTLVKEWRRYTHIKFHISPKKALPESSAESNIAVFLSAIPEKYHSDSLKKALEKAVKKYSIAYILAQIEYVNKHHPDSYIPYLQSALKSDFAKVKSKEAELEAREKVENLIEKIKAFDIHNIPLESEGNKAIYDVYVTKKSTVVISLLTENGVLVERYSLLSDADKAVKRLQELLKALKKSSKKQPA